MVVIEVNEVNTLPNAINSASPSQLIFIDFYATWCGPCLQIAPFIHELSHKYPNILFFKVDVDKNEQVAGFHNIQKLPTFVLYKNRVKVTEFSGASKEKIEQTIKSFENSSSEAEPSLDPGYLNLSQFFDSRQMVCLNESAENNFQSLLAGKSHLESDMDEQVIF
eukprot:Sdes_comp18336_c0_seq1m8067